MTDTTVNIRVATTPEDFEAFAQIVMEYVEWLRHRYRDVDHLVERVFSHQSFATEVADLSTAYAPPNGTTLLAWSGGEVCGGGAYRRLADGTCEMKRLFVRDRHHGRGIGRRLCVALIEAARADGFPLMRLDTGDRMTEAIGLYASLGFVSAAPHHVYPDDVVPYMAFMELPLTRSD